MPSWTKEQEDAIYKNGTNIIVSAGAGSGKTAVLTERVIQKILNGIHINELLILTFTKAAAGEMKERIRKALKKQHLDEELKLLDVSYITTFDSYALSIVKKYHYLLNISNNISIVESSLIEMEKKRIRDELFEEYYDKKDPLFLKLINDFCVRDDDNLKNYFLNMAKKLEMITDIDDYLDNYIADYYNEDYINKRIAEYEKIILEKKEELKRKIDDLQFLIDGDYHQKVLATLNSFLTCDNIDELFNYSHLKLPSLPRGSDDDAKNAKKNISNILDEIDNLLSYGTKDKIKQDIIQTKDYMEILIPMLKKYLNVVATYKQEHEMYEFTDIALLAIKVLKDNPDICAEVKNSLNEILVDEYQDTNDLQENFINLIANNNVYMVGDIKQSIYRFRNANPYIFKNKYDNYTLNKGGIKIDLVKNFRSRDIVLKNINEIFNLVMDNLIGGAEYQESHQMVFGNKTYINEGQTEQNYDMEILEYNLAKDSNFSKEEIEIFSVAKDIKDKVKNKYQIFDKDEQILRDINYGDFVILMDRTTNFNLYKKIFEYLEIPLTLYKDETLNNSDDIYIIKNLITLIIKINKKQYDTLFKYSFISCARSFLFNYPDKEIFNYFAHNNFSQSSIYQLFDNIDIQGLTPVQLLELIIHKTCFYEKIIKVGNIENRLVRLQKLLEMAHNLSNYGYDIEAFSDYLNTLVSEGYEIKYSLSTDNNNSVKLMTIHKSKGLEYHICYFTGLYKSFNISDLKDSFIYNNKYGFIIPYFKEGINYTIYKELLKQDYMNEEISEKIRLFYVALTRAKEKMIMLLPEKEEKDIAKEHNGVLDNTYRKNYRSFADIMYSVKNNLKKYYHQLDINSLNLTKDYLFIKDKKFNLELEKDKIIVQPLDIVPIKIEEATYSKKMQHLMTKEEQKNIEFGTKVHNALEHIDFKNYQNIKDEFLKEKIDKFLNHTIMKNLEQAKIYKELEFIYFKDNVKYHGIIDLMLEYDEYINIIDYKLKDITSDAYIKQLLGYKDYIKMKTNKEIFVYLYSIINDEIKEIKEY